MGGTWWGGRLFGWRGVVRCLIEGLVWGLRWDELDRAGRAGFQVRWLLTRGDRGVRAWGGWRAGRSCWGA